MHDIVVVGVTRRYDNSINWDHRRRSLQRICCAFLIGNADTKVFYSIVKCVPYHCLATKFSVCKNWCVWSSISWKQKCKWKRTCRGCPECYGESLSMSFMSRNMCSGDASLVSLGQQFLGLNATNGAVTTGTVTFLLTPACYMQLRRPPRWPAKCLHPQVGTCKMSCLSHSIVSFPKNIPACKSWCVSSSVAWINKCNWLAICDGCPECDCPKCYGVRVSVQVEVKVRVRRWGWREGSEREGEGCLLCDIRTRGMCNLETFAKKM